LEVDIGAGGQKNRNDGAISDGPKSFKIGIAVQTQYRRVTDIQPSFDSNDRVYALSCTGTKLSFGVLVMVLLSGARYEYFARLKSSGCQHRHPLPSLSCCCSKTQNGLILCFQLPRLSWKLAVKQV